MAPTLFDIARHDAPTAQGELPDVLGAPVADLVEPAEQIEQDTTPAAPAPVALELTIDGDATPFVSTPTRPTTPAPTPATTEPAALFGIDRKPAPLAAYGEQLTALDMFGLTITAPADNCDCGHPRAQHRRVPLDAARTWHECAACECLTPRL